jgi:ketosteroid isomerase-like protein
MTAQELLERTYAAFNARDIDAALAAMHPDVEWPNGMEGGSVHGHGGIRDYWTRQWGTIDPRVEPRGFSAERDGRVAVDVHQVVRDLAGHVLKDEMVQHVYRFEDGLVKSMEIRVTRGSAAPVPRRTGP